MLNDQRWPIRYFFRHLYHFDFYLPLRAVQPLRVDYLYATADCAQASEMSRDAVLCSLLQRMTSERSLFRATNSSYEAM